MNRSIRFVVIFVMIMFFALLANSTVNYVVRTDDLLNHPRNERVRDEQFGSERGPILVGNTPIAYNVETGTRPYAYAREYVNGPLYAPITGYYSYIYGSTGLEHTYNAELAGQADSQFLGRIPDVISGRPSAGGQVMTTINPEAQQAAWDALGGREGGIIAMDYTTGAILAWVSTPSYDPAPLAALNFPATQETWAQLTNDPARPMNDRATAEIYPPGSTFKIVVAAAALENGYTPDTLVDTPRELQLPQSTSVLPNESDCGDGQKTLDEAFTLSCNTSFANIGLDLGAEAIADQAEAFGFGDTFDSDVNSAASIFPDELDEAQLAMSSIGQFEVASTALQMAVVAGGVANGGTVMEPYVVGEVRNANQRIVESRSPTELGEAMSFENAQALAQMMVHVVESGTGTQARVPGLTVGGKTGTAETSAGVEPYSWFAGFSLENNVALAVYLGQPQGQTAAAAAQPVFQALA